MPNQSKDTSREEARLAHIAAIGRMDSKPAPAPDQQTDRRGWLMWRKGGIGGSDAAAIIGEDEYKTPLDVYADKTSDQISDEQSLACKRGTKMEPLVAEEYVEATGNRIRRQPSRVHPDHPFLRCSMDYQVASTDDRPTGLLECKTANSFVFSKIRLNGLPMRYWVQVQHNLMVCGYSWGAIAILQPDSYEFLTFEIERDDEFCSTLLQREIEFWQLVESRTPPSIDVAPVKMPEIGGGELVLVESLGDKAVAEYRRRITAYTQIKEIADEATAVLDAHKESLKAWMAGRCLDVVEGLGSRVYYKEQAGRRTLDKKAFKAAHPEIDLADYEKQGAPFRTFRVYQTQKQIEGSAS